MYRINCWKPVYEGDGTPGSGTPPPPPPPPGDKTFTQEEVNRMLAEDRRKHQEQVKKALGEVEALQKRANLTQKELTDLEARKEQLQKELLTKEELAAQQQQKMRQEYEQRIKETADERDAWAARFTESTITREILGAASEHGAYSPKQLVPLLRPLANLVEGTDEEGHPNGKFEVRVAFPTIGKDKKPVTLDLSPSEAIKRMAETEEYFNLFKVEGTGGLGLRTRPGTPGTTDWGELAKDPEKYREARKKRDIG